MKNGGGKLKMDFIQDSSNRFASGQIEIRVIAPNFFMNGTQIQFELPVKKPVQRLQF
jgi:hypothetical protein